MHTKTSFHLILILKIYEIDAITNLYFTDGGKGGSWKLGDSPQILQLKNRRQEFNSSLPAQSLSP